MNVWMVVRKLLIWFFLMSLGILVMINTHVVSAEHVVSAVLTIISGVKVVIYFNWLLSIDWEDYDDED